MTSKRFKRLGKGSRHSNNQNFEQCMALAKWTMLRIKKGIGIRYISYDMRADCHVRKNELVFSV